MSVFWNKRLNVSSFPKWWNVFHLQCTLVEKQRSILHFGCTPFIKQWITFNIKCVHCICCFSNEWTECCSVIQMVDTEGWSLYSRPPIWREVLEEIWPLFPKNVVLLRSIYNQAFVKSEVHSYGIYWMVTIYLTRELIWHLSQSSMTDAYWCLPLYNQGGNSTYIIHNFRSVL